MSLSKPELVGLHFKAFTFCLYTVKLVKSPALKLKYFIIFGTLNLLYYVSTFCPMFSFILNHKKKRGDPKSLIYFKFIFDHQNVPQTLSFVTFPN